ncbi:CD209 antigen-like protein E isoform X2 [Hemibagrus wyckioides]|uniref:CD209 antigen-like protein E isoform X2 n=1 Tax=Hemibagrus wyckioides TaxID=337641 RepID=UPI00266D9365|nr:CD209 antigen-like protein E isoform X2 [Hemibagrus wyckioides]
MEDKIEVEMKELTPGEEQDNKDDEKGKMDETKEAETKKGEANVYCKLKNPQENIYSLAMPTSSPEHKEAEKVEEKERAEKEEAEAEQTNVYTRLDNPSENVYMSVTSSTAKQNEDVYRKVRLYKRISTIFIFLSLLLLAVVLALAMKLSEVQSSEKCPDLITEVNKIHNYSPKQGCQCSECGEDWEKFANSCYFFSKERLKWQESREVCQKQGGDLVVIDNEHMQRFLTENGNMLYWIGLKKEQQWNWINSTAPTMKYWSYGQPNPDSQGFCALLNGGSKLNNWLSNSCEVYSNFICQKR